VDLWICVIHTRIEDRIDCHRDDSYPADASHFFDGAMHQKGWLWGFSCSLQCIANHSSAESRVRLFNPQLRSEPSCLKTMTVAVDCSLQFHASIKDKVNILKTARQCRRWTKSKTTK
jgi:hypothetical protein